MPASGSGCPRMIFGRSGHEPLPKAAWRAANAETGHSDVKMGPKRCFSGRAPIPTASGIAFINFGREQL